MAGEAFSSADIVLIVSLSYLAFDICCMWEDFETCPKPIHHWLLVSYALLGSSRIAVGIGSRLQVGHAGSFLINSRQKGKTLQLLHSIIWMGFVPLITMWNGMGSWWTWEVLTQEPNCMPTGTHLSFLLLWQMLSYAWIIVYGGLGAVACILERRLRRAEADLRDLEDPDVVQRWGNVGQLDGYTSMPEKMAGGGMTPARIKALGGESTCGLGDMLGQDCPICLNAVCAGDTIRTLGKCKHVFHRACLDLWLLRSAECPMCKSRVEATGSREP